MNEKLVEARRQMEAARPQTDTSLAITDEILLERLRQVRDEGWKPDHDDMHRNGEIAGAAACYALQAAKHWMAGEAAIKTLWPWDAAWWKPTNPRRDLIKAAALIVAEIERLDRTTAL